MVKTIVKMAPLYSSYPRNAPYQQQARLILCVCPHVTRFGNLGGLFGDEVVWCSSAMMGRVRQACIRHASDKVFFKKRSC